MGKPGVLGSLAAAATAVAAIGVLVVAAPASAQDCPANPQGLGTSRVLNIEPGESVRFGLMQYRQTLPLADKEVVLTFDDGPLPRYSDQVLEILAAQCVKATYFLVGRMAREFPEAVRRIYAAGHTVGTHTQNHPLRIHKMSSEKVAEEIDAGIASVAEALGDPHKLAPFFRIPGLLHTETIESELAARKLVVFSADVVADDWHRHIRPSEVIRRAMSRLEARGKGILLLHDIHPVTVTALPGLLKELKEHGFHVVHVVPAEEPGRIEAAEQAMPPTPQSVADAPAEWTSPATPEGKPSGIGHLAWRHGAFAPDGTDGDHGDVARRLPDPPPNVTAGGANSDSLPARN